MMWMARHLADIFDVFDSHMKGFVRDKRPVGRVVGYTEVIPKRRFEKMDRGPTGVQNLAFLR
jgi:hypothetical protein